MDGCSFLGQIFYKKKCIIVCPNKTSIKIKLIALESCSYQTDINRAHGKFQFLKVSYIYVMQILQEAFMKIIYSWEKNKPGKFPVQEHASEPGRLSSLFLHARL